MPLSYNNNTPQAGQTVASTQAPILTNFQSIDTALNGPTGGGSGGGNFTTYAVQNTTASFAAKPVNPIGVLHTIASSAGNPELAWINNVDATGVGPFNGTQLTGGGITAAVWVNFIGATGGINASFNVSSVTRNGVGDYTIAFSRNFTAATYAPLITQDNANVLIATFSGVVSKGVASIRFNTKTSSGVTDPVTVSVVIFGTLV